MIAEVYRIITLFVLPGLLLAFGLSFFFLSIPAKDGLKSYRAARLVMGYSYVIYAVSIFTAHYRFFNFEPSPFSQAVSLFISCYQAFLFTFTLIVLIDIGFFSRRRVLKEIAVITLTSTVILTLSYFLPLASAQIAVYLFTVFYVLLLVRYVYMFRRHYRGYTDKMDNYFSDEETHRLHWVLYSFYAATAIGVVALFFTLFQSMMIALPFMVIVLLFYSAFGIRFINYAFMFQDIEIAIAEAKDDVMEISDSTEPFVCEDNESLMRRIDALMETEQLYKKSNVSIEEIAQALSEKHHIVSATINRCRGINFKTYINEYRVREASRLLSEDKECRLTVDAIAEEAGFSDRSNFYRVFKKQKGLSPSDFRKSC